MPTRTKAPTGASITIPNPESFLEDSKIPQPYSVEFTLEGTRAYLFNRYDVPANPEEPKKGVKIERPLGQMVTIDSDGHLAARAVQVWNSVVAAGKYRPNPRSSRGSLSTILKEAMEVDGLDDRHPDLLTFRAPSGEAYERWEWEFTARTAHSGSFGKSYVTKVRPAIHPGWQLAGLVTILQPEYCSLMQLHEAFSMAGRFGGIGDGRTGGLGFGRFLVRRFESV